MRQCHCITIVTFLWLSVFAVTAVAQEQEHKNTLKWSTASEVYNFGYDIYRAEQKTGPFIRITKTPVPGAGTTDVPTHYEYIDDSIDPYQSYYYYIESISLSGERKKFTPTLEADPKLKN